jgi:alpha-tubulin suppressor-like RCC1 family protein
MIPGCTTNSPAENNVSSEKTPVPGTVAPHRVIAVSAGTSHSLALLDNGSVVAWGSDSSGECDVPRNLTNVTGISAGNGFSVAVKNDGSVVAWGCREDTRQYDIRHPQAAVVCDNSCPCTVPPDLTQVKTVSAGENCVLALKRDGTVIAWGRNYSAECHVPIGLKNVTTISAGSTHSLALRDDGTIVVWGRYLGRIPTGYQKYTGIAAGHEHSLLLKDDGTIDTFVGARENDLPLYHPELTNVTAISAGPYYFLALLRNGSVVSWGYQKNSISYNLNTTGKNITNITAISAGYWHSLALKDDGTIVAWGDCGSDGSCNVPTQFAAEFY